MKLMKLPSFPYGQGDPMLRFAFLDGDVHSMVGSMKEFPRMYGDFVQLKPSASSDSMMCKKRTWDQSGDLGTFKKTHILNMNIPGSISLLEIFSSIFRQILSQQGEKNQL